MFFSPKSLFFGLLGLKVICPEGLGRLRWTIFEVKIYTFFTFNKKRFLKKGIVFY